MAKIIGRLTALPAAGIKAWRSLRSTRQRIEAGVAFTAAVGCIVAAAIQVGPALATEKIEGKPVPGELLSAIVVGSTSCPALTGPRLAAQLMAASEFQAAAKSDTGEGLADLGTDEFKIWAPWPDAQRTDAMANVLALAHRTCKAVGQVRVAGVEDDQWEAAVAADIAGLDAVKQAKGVPDEAKKDVEIIAGYANWYAEQPQFAGAGDKNSPGTTATPATTPVKVPDEYVDLVVKAGRICSGVLPAPRAAAALMALSAFNPNLKGTDGGQGIAQFKPAMWDRYAPSAKASVWDPKVSIPALGTALCDLKNQLSSLKTDGSADQITMAMSAFQWGVTAVRAEGGVPRSAAVAQLPDLVNGYLETYTADTRLSGTPTAPKSPSASPSPSASKPASPSPAPSQSASAEPSAPDETEPAPQEPTTPATDEPKKWDGSVNWQISNVHSGRVVDVPGDDNISNSGTTMQLWDNQHAKDQSWHIANAPDADYVVITNDNTGKSLGIRDGSGDNGAELVMLDSNRGDENQQWTMREAGDGKYFIVNRRTGKALDILGDDCCGENGTPVTQWDLQENAADQRWTLSR